MTGQQLDIFGAVPEPVPGAWRRVAHRGHLRPVQLRDKSPKRILIVSSARPLDPGRVEITIRVGAAPLEIGKMGAASSSSPRRHLHGNDLG